jgi:hypothetical protein
LKHKDCFGLAERTSDFKLLKERKMDTTEEVARALCRATGKNPDEMQIDRPQRIPQWHLYEAEARKFIAAYNVMAGTASSRPQGKS